MEFDQLAAVPTPRPPAPASRPPVRAEQPADARVAVLEPPATASGVLGWFERRGVRVDPGRRGALAVGVAALVTALVVGWWVLLGRPHAAAITPTPSLAPAPSTAPRSSGGAPASTSPSATPTGAAVVVDVVGKVRRPGVYRLPAGSRVDDALRAAGGALTGVDLASLNLARKLIDGEQIPVGVDGATSVPVAAGSGAAAGTSGSVSGPIDLNAATLAQLDGLPGVGPVLAQHILDWRTAHGRFDSVDQLRDVSGIGPSKFATLRPLVTV